MFRNLRKCFSRRYSINTPIQSFLTNEYKCVDAWNLQTSSPILTKINLNDFYNILEQNYSSKGVISAIDVDIFANALKDPGYLEELKELLHRLRLSAETGNTLESTHHATIRNFLEFGHVNELVYMLQDPLNYGIFLDSYSANILLDYLIANKNYELAAKVASLQMLQEDFSHDICNALAKYACYKFLIESDRPSDIKPPEESKESKKKVEEIKIRIKYLRNPYYDDHFDIKDVYLLSGKTLAWMSKRSTDNVNNNLQIIGWLFYKKYEKLLEISKELSSSTSFKVFTEALNLIERELKHVEDTSKSVLETCIGLLKKSVVDTGLEKSMKIEIENAINKMQMKDISAQNEIFKAWAEIREERLDEQSKRLDGARRIKEIEEQQKNLQVEEQKLWFFENEEQIDLQIEEKEALVDKTTISKNIQTKSDDSYIPPEILPKRR